MVALEARHLDHAELVFRVTAAQWRRTEPDVKEWAAAFVAMLVTVNDSELHRVLYNTAPRSAAIADQAARVVNELADEVAFHLRRWGRPAGARQRARIAIVAILAVVHEIVIQLPTGRARTRAVTLVIEMAVGLPTFRQLDELQATT